MEAETQFRLRQDKLIEAVIYLSEGSADDPNFSVIKLVHLLYYADCAAYLKHGAPITGATYLHFPHGPYPEHWYKVRRQMQAAGDVEVLYEDSYDGHHRYRLLPNRAVENRKCLPMRTAPSWTNNGNGLPLSTLPASLNIPTINSAGSPPKTVSPYPMSRPG